MIKLNLQLFGGRGGGSGMGSGGGGSVAESRAAYGTSQGTAQFTARQIEDASDDYWNSGWNNKRDAARILSGDLTEDQFVNKYAKDGIKSDKTIQDSIDKNGRNYTNQDWSAKSETEWKKEGSAKYYQAKRQAEQYSIGDIAKRLGVSGVNWSTPESEARRILGNNTYNELLEMSKLSARRAVNSHKRGR